MIKVSASVCIDAPVERVWTPLAELESIHWWAMGIVRSHCVGTQARGVGAVRVCELKGDVRVTETMVASTEGRSLGYFGDGRYAGNPRKLLPIPRRCSSRSPQSA